ncbi:hypothetical protein psyc5s11_04220 [Clostridium gelidum]|uniref:Uncharacterized protein n=1 Tax=Clostridium gelidum TaxID=704125 RepID=A0ABM7SXJ3_9CLOT|nr:hypothetical protein psyc5s11_04220 [Clostridium gelidum]
MTGWKLGKQEQIDNDNINYNDLYYHYFFVIIYSKNYNYLNKL